MERIVKTPGVCGGSACVRDTRVPVWTLQRLRELGASDRALLEDFPSLTAEDLRHVWAYVPGHPEEIRDAIERQAVNGAPGPAPSLTPQCGGTRRSPTTQAPRGGAGALPDHQPAPPGRLLGAAFGA
jgi:uncharacterized protein (DUF433 family)